MSEHGEIMVMSDQNKEFLKLMQKQEPLLPELQPYLEEADKTWGWQMLRHPLVFSVPYMPNMNAIYNEQYLKKREHLDRCFQNGDWSTYVFLHERPYRFGAFNEIGEDIESDRDYWELFGHVWVDSENIWQNVYYVRQALKVDRSDREYMMNEDERKFLSELPDEFAIYRGHTRRNRKGYSWTLNYEKAKWFAERFNEKSSSVASATCSKENVIAIFLGRNEFEVVVDPINLKIQKYLGVILDKTLCTTS